MGTFVHIVDIAALAKLICVAFKELRFKVTLVEGTMQSAPLGLAFHSASEQPFIWIETQAVHVGAPGGVGSGSPPQTTSQLSETAPQVESQVLCCSLLEAGFIQSLYL
ncbi:MAG: hypothetical protein AB1564_16955 [Chloroflexota bacterium]